MRVVTEEKVNRYTERYLEISKDLYESLLLILKKEICGQHDYGKVKNMKLIEINLESDDHRQAWFLVRVEGNDT